MSEKVGYRYGEFWYYSEHMTEMSRPKKKKKKQICAMTTQQQN